jgi:hypothetical protein
MHRDDPGIHALNWALEALDSASTYLTLATLWAEDDTARNEAAVLAAAVEAETCARCSTAGLTASTELSWFRSRARLGPAYD